MARGNTVAHRQHAHGHRAGRRAAAGARGGATPRSGTAITHRVLVLLSGALAVNPGWLGPNASIRAGCEPMLNAWASKLLGRRHESPLHDRAPRPPTGAVAETRTLPLSALRIAPLDMVYGVEAEHRRCSHGRLAERDRTACAVSRQAHVQAASIRGPICACGTRGRPISRPARSRCSTCWSRRAAMRRLLARVRGAEPEDLNPPERAANGTIDAGRPGGRVGAGGEPAGRGAQAARGARRQTCRDDGRSLARRGVEAGRVSASDRRCPQSPRARARPRSRPWCAQANALLKTSGSRLDQMAALRALPVATDPRGAPEPTGGSHARGVRPILRGAAEIQMHCPAAAELKAALAASEETQGGDALAANTWFSRHARVRDGVASGGYTACATPRCSVPAIG